VLSPANWDRRVDLVLKNPRRAGLRDSSFFALVVLDPASWPGDVGLEGAHDPDAAVVQPSKGVGKSSTGASLFDGQQAAFDPAVLTPPAGHG